MTKVVFAETCLPLSRVAVGRGGRGGEGRMGKEATEINYRGKRLKRNGSDIFAIDHHSLRGEKRKRGEEATPSPSRRAALSIFMTLSW